ncbi:MAG TPA: hypothetical protein VGB38_00040 [bacterium]
MKGARAVVVRFGVAKKNPSNVVGRDDRSDKNNSGKNMQIDSPVKIQNRIPAPISTLGDRNETQNSRSDVALFETVKRRLEGL